MERATESDESKAFFAALLAASRNNCDCEVCVTLRSIADKMIADMMPKGDAKVVKGRKV